MNYPTYFGNQTQNGQQFQQPGPMQPRLDMQNYQQQPVMQQPQMQPVQTMQNYQQTPQQTFSPASRMVASRNEAESTPCDLSGAPMAFYDVSKDCFYMKRWDNASGSAIFTDYSRTDGQNVQFASKQEVRELTEMVEMLMQDVDQLKRPNNHSRKVNDEK